MNEVDHHDRTYGNFQAGDLFIAHGYDDVFVLLSGSEPNYWDVLVLSSRFDNKDLPHRLWLRKASRVPFCYDVFRGADLVSERLVSMVPKPL